jgi:hypothetical protein
VDRFACAHCGSEYLVRRGGGIVSLSPVVKELKGVREGVDRTASELAIQRLQRTIDELAVARKEADQKRLTAYVALAFVPLLCICCVSPMLSVEKAASDTAIIVLDTLAIVGTVFVGIACARNLGKRVAEADRAIAVTTAELARHKRLVTMGEESVAAPDAPGAPSRTQHPD